MIRLGAVLVAAWCVGWVASQWYFEAGWFAPAVDRTYSSSPASAWDLDGMATAREWRP